MILKKAIPTKSPYLDLLLRLKVTLLKVSLLYRDGNQLVLTELFLVLALLANHRLLGWGQLGVVVVHNLRGQIDADSKFR